MVDGMLRRTAGKSVHYAVELVILDLFMEFGEFCHYSTASGNYQRRHLCPLEPPSLVDVIGAREYLARKALL